MKRVVGWILLFFAVSGVASVLRRLGAGVSTEYEQTALALEVGIIILLLIFGWRLVRRPAKPDAERRGDH
jgi:hypothetical protein